MNLLTSMAFVFCSFLMQIRFRNETLKTEVCKKSLNPQWNSEWFKFEVSSVGGEGGEGLEKAIHTFKLTYELTHWTFRLKKSNPTK